jgi:hypothetical protein
MDRESLRKTDALTEADYYPEVFGLYQKRPTQTLSLPGSLTGASDTAT